MSTPSKYVHPGLLCLYGFNENAPSATKIIGGRTCTFFTTYMKERDVHLIIAYNKYRTWRTNWFFGTISGMTEEESTGSKSEEFNASLEKIIARKNRVAGRDLLKKLEEATGVVHNNP